VSRRRDCSTSYRFTLGKTAGVVLWSVESWEVVVSTGNARGRAGRLQLCGVIRVSGIYHLLVICAVSRICRAPLTGKGEAHLSK